MPDWGPALVAAGLGGEDWGPVTNGSYAELAARWRGSKPLPSEVTLSGLAAVATAGTQVTKLANQVLAFMTARLAIGFADAGTGKNWPCDPQSGATWGQLIALSGFDTTATLPVNNSYNLIAGDGSIVTLNSAQTFALLRQRVIPWAMATATFGQQMIGQIKIGNPPADITVGWP